MSDRVAASFSEPPEGTVFDRQTLDEDHCFLCGTELTDDSRTDEHIIPRWLQRRFDLWDKKLTLPNGTGIPYRQLVIPCCHDCNTSVLSELESEIETAMAGGFHRFRLLPDNRLFEWCGKIFYGIMFRDTQLLWDRRTGGPETIIEQDTLRNLFTIHLFLQTLHVPFEFVGFKPHSVFVFETEKFDSHHADFDFHHYYEAVTPDEGPKPVCVLGLRCADIGIICVFLDNGLQKETCQASYDEFIGIPLVPLQFVEFVCKASCQEYARNYPSRYKTWTKRSRVAGCRVERDPSPIAGPMYSEMNPKLYFNMLYHGGQQFFAPSLRQEWQELMANENIVVQPTFLHDALGRPLRWVDGYSRPALILPPSYRRQ